MSLTSVLRCQLGRCGLEVVAKRFSSSSTSTHLGYDLKGYRSLLSIKGPDAPVFLQNIITNDIYKLNSTPTIKSLFALILNSRGRVLYDTCVHMINPNPGAVREYFLELDTNVVQECVAKLLGPLKLRKQVEITKLDADYKLFALVPNKQLELATNQLDSRVELVQPDPRYSGLGYRAIVKTNDPNIKSTITK